MTIKMYFANNPIENNDDFDSKMYKRSNWTPPPWTENFELTARLDAFQKRCRHLFKKKKGRSNLLPHFRAALQYLQSHPELMMVICDKGLGPAVILRTRYIQLGYTDHLDDSTTYKFLTPFEATMRIGQIRIVLQNWINKYAATVNSQCKKYMNRKLRDNTDPYSYLYLTMKVHKGLDPLTTRPICSCSGSLLEPLGLAVNKLLQPFAQSQPYYLKNSLELVQDLRNLDDFPPNTYLFTADAKSMYTNLLVDHCCSILNDWLEEKERLPYPDDPNDDPTLVRKAIISGLKILMKHNIMRFGDAIILQKEGAAMGLPPTPAYANASFGVHEIGFVDTFLLTNLHYYRRYIDDVFGIISINSPGDQTRWLAFQTQLQAFPGLEWKITPLTKQVDFLDLTISIGEDNQIHTTLYEKELNLHLYLPPHSAHPPGVLNGLIHGNIHRIYKLCSDHTDRIGRTHEMYHHLLARGHKPSSLLPTFKLAIRKALAHASVTNTTIPATQQLVIEPAQPNLVFFHLRYHPDGPKSSAIQQAWRETVSHPLSKTPLESLQNHASWPFGPNRLVVAYSRPLNIGNLLSSRKVPDTGPSVSSFKE